HRSADQAYEFTPNRNFYYLTGLNREEFILLMFKYEGNLKEHLFITKPDPDIEKWIGIRMRIDEAKEASGIENVNYVENFPGFFNSVVNNHYFTNIYLDTEYHEDMKKLGLKF